MGSGSTRKGTACALITAAGKSTRMAGGKKKEYRLIDNKPVLQRICNRFIETELFKHLLITCPPGGEAEMRGILGDDVQDLVTLVAGGSTRQSSVLAGLSALVPLHIDWVLIHDGSRPWISGDLISRILSDTARYGACIPAIPSVDTLVLADGIGDVASYPDRDTVLHVQTPQGFSFNEIYSSHLRASSDGRGYNDDSEIYRTYCGAVHIIPGDPENRKITYPRDIPSRKSEDQKPL